MDKPKNFFKENKPFIYITFAIFLSYVVYNLPSVLDVASDFLALFTPLFIAIGLSFVMNIPMSHLENLLSKLNKKLPKKKLSQDIIRALAIALTIIIFILIMILFTSFIVPKISDSISMIVSNLDSYITRLTNWINKISRMLNLDYSITRKEVANWFTTANISGFLSTLLGIFAKQTSVTQVLNSISSTFITAISAFFMSLYLLSNKERHINQLRKATIFFFGKDNSIRLFTVAAEADHYFSVFISGQVLEAIIFMIETYILMRLFSFPFPELIAIVAFFFAFIPMFGGFFTFFIGLFLVAAAKSSAIILFIIVFLCLQQFEGNVVYPRVVGKSVGISGLFVLVGLTVFGGLFGFIGVLLAVPLTAIMYAITSRVINIHLFRKHIEVKGENVYELDDHGNRKDVLY